MVFNMEISVMHVCKIVDAGFDPRFGLEPDVKIVNNLNAEDYVSLITNHKQLKQFGCKNIYNCSPITIYKPFPFLKLTAIEVDCLDCESIPEAVEYIRNNSNKLYHSIYIRKDNGRVRIRVFRESCNRLTYMFNKIFVWKNKIELYERK